MLIDWLIEEFQYKIEGSCDFNWNCFISNVRLIDFNNVTAMVSPANKRVLGFIITPVNDPQTQYVWVIETHEVAFKKEAAKRGATFIHLHSQRAALDWARKSFKNQPVDLDEVYELELNLSDDVIQRIRELEAQGISFDKLLEEAVLNHESNDITSNPQASSDTA